MPRLNSLLNRLRYGRAWDDWDEDEGEEDAAAKTREQPRSRRRRVAVTLAFVTLFVAGAAFSAAAGDEVRSALENQSTDAESTDATPTDTTTTGEADPAPAEEPPTAPAAPADPATEPAPAPAPAPEAPAPAPADPAESDPAAAPAAPTATAPEAPAAASAAVQQAAKRLAGTRPASRHARRSHESLRTMRAYARRHHFPKRVVKAQPPELEGAKSAVVWLNRALPDPTPPALRLKPQFARHLQAVAKAKRVDWALMLGVLRAEGRNGSAPADFAGLRAVAGQLGDQGTQRTPWVTLFATSNSTAFADRALALAHYYRAVGMPALVNGLVRERAALEHKVLNDQRVSIYSGGRGDIEAGRVNVRVLAAIEYLADSFGQVTVSCLISGHPLYARPGVISAHIYGLAADISELAGTSITGHQQPGSVTERGVRDLLLLPPELMPKQVISLLGLGGPSIPLANHYDHIHIGY
jgi:hypothetical protein